MEKVILDDVSLEFHECAAYSQLMLPATSI